MKHRKTVGMILVILLCSVLAGCGNSEAIATVESTTAETVSVPAEQSNKPPLDLSVITRREVSDTQDELVWDGQVIGGIRLTDLQEECLDDSQCRHLHEYLSIFAPYPSFRFEYISQHGDNEAFISLKIEEVETGSVNEQSHHLFEKDAAFYDFWVDNSVVRSEDRDILFESITEES